MVHLTTPIGPLMVFYSAARDLRLTETIRLALAVDRPTASRVLTLALNHVGPHLPMVPVEEWAREPPLPRWERLSEKQVARATLEDPLAALCRPTARGDPT